jgi:hypothetical protein
MIWPPDSSPQIPIRAFKSLLSTLCMFCNRPNNDIPTDGRRRTKTNGENDHLSNFSEGSLLTPDVSSTQAASAPSNGQDCASRSFQSPRATDVGEEDAANQLIREPGTRPISLEQLVTQVKGILRGSCDGRV